MNTDSRLYKKNRGKTEAFPPTVEYYYKKVKDFPSGRTYPVFDLLFRYK